MKKNKEVNIAFRLWDQITQLESILWDRYRDEFLDLTIEQDDTNLSRDDRQNTNDPLQSINNVMDRNDHSVLP